MNVKQLTRRNRSRPTHVSCFAGEREQWLVGRFQPKVPNTCLALQTCCRCLELPLRNLEFEARQYPTSMDRVGQTCEKRGILPEALLVVKTETRCVWATHSEQQLHPMLDILKYKTNLKSEIRPQNICVINTLKLFYSQKGSA